MYLPPKVKQILSEYDFSLWLNKPLTKKETDLLCQELNLPSYNPYECCKWQTVKLYLKELKYQIEDKRIYIDGNRIRVVVITIKKSW